MEGRVLLRAACRGLHLEGCCGGAGRALPTSLFAKAPGVSNADEGAALAQALLSVTSLTLDARPEALSPAPTPAACEEDDDVGLHSSTDFVRLIGPLSETPSEAPIAGTGSADDAAAAATVAAEAPVLLSSSGGRLWESAASVCAGGGEGARLRLRAHARLANAEVCASVTDAFSLTERFWPADTRAVVESHARASVSEGKEQTVSPAVQPWAPLAEALARGWAADLGLEIARVRARWCPRLPPPRAEGGRPLPFSAP